MKPNSFNIPILTEGSDCYSIRVIPRGLGTSDAGDANTSRLYRIFMLKGTLNREGKVEGEFVLYPVRTVVFTWSTGVKGKGGLRLNQLPMDTPSVKSFNLRLVETKTGKVVYTIITQISVGDAIRANVGDSVTAVTS